MLVPPPRQDKGHADDKRCLRLTSQLEADALRFGHCFSVHEGCLCVGAGAYHLGVDLQAVRVPSSRVLCFEA